MLIFLAILVVVLVIALIVLIALLLKAKNTPIADATAQIHTQLEAFEERVRERFKVAASDALQQNQEILLSQAKLVMENAKTISSAELQKQGLELQKTLTPLQQSLQKLENELKQIEQARVGAYAGLGEQLSQLSATQVELRKQTGNLVDAMRNPKLRGNWGEMQLRRVVEFSGMTNYVDFQQEVSITSGEGDRLRPDMTVKLPNGRTIVVDSKVPLEAYLKATLSDNPDVKKQEMENHARQLKNHFKKLGEKKYFEQFERTPEFVVLFLNMESSLSAALEVQPQLIEEAMAEKVLIATPTTLIALLKAVAYGWGEAQSSQKAREILEYGKELFNRLHVVNEAWAEVGDRLRQSVESYNRAVVSVESRLLVSARKIANKTDWELPPLSVSPSVVPSIDKKVQ